MHNNEQEYLNGSELLLQKMPLYAQARRQYMMRFEDKNAECNTLAYRADTYPLLHLIRCCDNVIDGYSIDESIENDAFTGIQESKHILQRNWQRGTTAETSASPELLSVTNNKGRKEEENSSEKRVLPAAEEEQKREKTEKLLLRAMMSSSAITESVISGPQVNIGVTDNNASFMNTRVQRLKTSNVRKQTISDAHDNARTFHEHKRAGNNKNNITDNVYNKVDSSSNNTDAATELWYELTSSPSPSCSLAMANADQEKSKAVPSLSNALQKEWNQTSGNHVTSSYERNLRWYVQSSAETRQLLNSIYSNVIPAQTNICERKNTLTPSCAKATNNTSAVALVPTESKLHTDNKEHNNTIAIYSAAKQLLNDKSMTPIHSWANSLWSILQTSYTTTTITTTTENIAANNNKSSFMTNWKNEINDRQTTITTSSSSSQYSLSINSVSSPIYMIDESSGVTSHDRTQIASYLKRVRWIMEQQQQQINNTSSVSESNGLINQAQRVTHSNTRHDKPWHSLTEGERVQREMEHTFAERKRFRRERVKLHDNVANVNDDDSGSDINDDHKEIVN